MQAELVFPAQALLGEGPLWFAEEERLYWLDIESQQLHRFDPIRSEDEFFPLPNKVGCYAPCENGNLLIATQTGIEEVRPLDGRLESLGIKTHPEAAKTGNRYNDGKCSPEGRFWFGSLNMEHQTGMASLYVLDRIGCRTVLTGATNSNGLGWSPDGTTFYWIDTPTRRITAFDYNLKRGELSNRRAAVTFPEQTDWGRPDGMTVDAEGMIWVAHWLGGRVTRWNPATGELFETIRVPVSRVTSVTFGGRDLQTLFITTASKEMTPDEKKREPDAGGLFHFRTNTTGLPVSCYRG